jgi:hypothetical protein
MPLSPGEFILQVARTLIHPLRIQAARVGQRVRASWQGSDSRFPHDGLQARETGSSGRV